MHSKREFLTGVGAGLGLAAAAAVAPAFAQDAPLSTPAGVDEGPRPRKKVPNRMAKTTPLFKSPGRWPNALGSSPRGLWVGEQHLLKSNAASVNVPWPTHTNKEQAWLMDLTGKILMQRESDSSNMVGVVEGNGSLWIAADDDAPKAGIYKVDLASGKQTAHLQVPLSPGGISGHLHGLQWQDGKLWVSNDRMKSLMRIDPMTWTPELEIPMFTPPGMSRYHGITIDKDGSILQVIADDQSTSYKDPRFVAGLSRMDQDGKAIETITFVPGSCDPHGLAYHDGQLYGCDAGYHPGWHTNYDSPFSAMIFRIDII